MLRGLAVRKFLSRGVKKAVISHLVTIYNSKARGFLIFSLIQMMSKLLLWPYCDCVVMSMPVLIESRSLTDGWKNRPQLRKTSLIFCICTWDFVCDHQAKHGALVNSALLRIGNHCCGPGQSLLHGWRVLRISSWIEVIVFPIHEFFWEDLKRIVVWFHQFINTNSIGPNIR